MRWVVHFERHLGTTAVEWDSGGSYTLDAAVAFLERFSLGYEPDQQVLTYYTPRAITYRWT